MDAQGIKRKDTIKGPPLRILSLDGGGVRGYSMFLIIQDLMHRTFVETEGRAPRRAEIPKPCDHFDLIVGTGTGGLIALMLGRLRLDLETCKELYVRLTRIVFETDKTIAGIPYRSTLFKATKLEEVIKECVKEHTVSESEGNDDSAAEIMSPMSATARSSAARSSAGSPRRQPSNASVISFSARSPTAQMSKPFFSTRGGNANARLYDEREDRTKTAVTAVYKGTSKGVDPALLRSYDSRREPAPEFDCKIWEAGRATCAIGLAFKPIQIGQSVFHDDGGGTFNPAPHALDEAVSEWPGREVGVFVSVGTGKRPKNTDANSSAWYEGFLGEFAEARRRLIAKIEGCETIHEYVRREHLQKRGVNIENYYRFNVEVGVGEFGMNEWNRLAEISNSTRQYMQRHDEQTMARSASTKLAKIAFAKQRYGRANSTIPELAEFTPDIMMPLAVELPGDIPTLLPPGTPPSRQSYDSGSDRLSVPGPSPRNSHERIQQGSVQQQQQQQQPHSAVADQSPRPLTGAAGNGKPRPSSLPSQPQPSRPNLGTPGQSASRRAPETEDASARPSSTSNSNNRDDDRLMVSAPTPEQYRRAAVPGPESKEAGGRRSQPQSQSQPQAQPYRIEPPPLPPKTPIGDRDAPTLAGSKRPGAAPPYPLEDDPPPVVNLAKKPNYRGR